ncbi:MAG: sortase [Clostridia bacterium]|nr:sortase [Clostridia bacterium]
MNQILITEKLYITPELRRQKRLYKIDFIISVFLLCLLFSYYIFSEYDKYAGEKKSQEILASMTIPETMQSTYVYDDTTIRVEDNEKIVVILEDPDSSTVIDPNNLDNSKLTAPMGGKVETLVTESGDKYYRLAIIRIPKIDLEYGIVDHWSNELLKMSPCKFHGCDPNEVGNFCIVGHNYRNDKFFSHVPELVNGDIIEIEDNYRRKVNYEVYDKHVVTENDTRDTTQITHGKREITLITCTDDSKNRVIVRAREKI